MMKPLNFQFTSPYWELASLIISRWRFNSYLWVALNAFRSIVT